MALWPGSTLHYLETMKEVRYEDFKIKSFGNRFDYLGDGMTKAEKVGDADLATYVRKTDDSPIVGSKFVYTKAGPELSELTLITAKAEEKK